MTIKIGKKYKFNTTDTELQKYNGTTIEVIRPLTEKECDINDVGNMYKAKFNDGCERDVFEDELDPHIESFKWEVHWMQTEHSGSGVHYSNAETMEAAIKECKQEKMYDWYSGELIRPDLKITDIYQFVQHGE